MEATTAYSTLRHKGYGEAGMGLAATAAKVPASINTLALLNDIWTSR
jgi:hypothetical protein